MKHICELQKILEQHFDWNKSRLTVMTNLLIGLFIVRTVNLSDLATVLFSNAKIESNYKRIQRFFKWIVSVNEANYLLTEFVILVLNLKNRMNDLSLDRTDWKFGKKHINILTLGVNIKGVAIPLAWISLGRAGNSKTADRISILSRVINEIKIKSLTADREFIGEAWFKFLINSNIPIYIRVKEDAHMTDPDKVAAWMLLLTIAATWVMKTSLMLKEKIRVAGHGRPRKSVFRNGFDKLRRSLIHPLEEGLKELCHYIYLLRDTKCPLDMV
jgi:hypothetical protein